MKKIIAAIAALTAYKLATAKKADAWFAATHRDITSKALALLEKEGKAKQFAFYKPYEEQLTAGCTEPDNSGDVDRGSGRHYYSICNPKGKELPATAGYYRNRKDEFSKSARTSLEENYTSALCLYKSGNIERAMHVFARAAHFIEDMSCTVHVSNIRYFDRPKNIHNAYEKHINTICGQFTAERFDKRLLKSYEGDSFETAANKLIKYSSKYVSGISTLDPRAFDEAAKDCLVVGQQNVMALMLKFYDDCQQDRGNYIVDGKQYTLKNEASGLIVTVTDKGIILDKPDKSKQQKLTAKIYDLGSFGFQAEDTGFINEKFKGLDYLKRDSVPALFRLAALGKKRFRITVGGTEYEKVLSCTNNGNLSIESFDPENKLQIWVIG